MRGLAAIAVAVSVSVVAAAVLVVAGCGAGAANAPIANSALPDAALVSCDGDRAVVETPRVLTRPDGIHIRFRNEAGRPLSYSVESPRAGGIGSDVPETGTEAVVALPPGPIEVLCFDDTSGVDPSELERAEFDVVDVDGFWTPTVLGCSARVGTDVDYAPDAKGKKGEPADAVRSDLRDDGLLQPGDVVEPAGYPEQEGVVVRLVRDGETLAVFYLREDGDGGWLRSSTMACAGIGFG